MKKRLLVLALFLMLFTVGVQAQNVGSGAPTAAIQCGSSNTNGSYFDYTNSILYTCSPNGQWVAGPYSLIKRVTTAPVGVCGANDHPQLVISGTGIGGWFTCQNLTSGKGTWASTIPNTAPKQGVTSGIAASAGNVGEVISTLVASGSAVSLTTATPAAVLSISLTAGDWDVQGSVVVAGASTTIAAGSAQELSVNSAAGCVTPAQVTDGSELFLAPPAVTTTSAKFGGTVPKKVFNVSATTTVCVVATTTFTAGTEGAYGTLIARRVE